MIRHPGVANRTADGSWMGAYGRWMVGLTPALWASTPLNPMAPVFRPAFG